MEDASTAPSVIAAVKCLARCRDPWRSVDIKLTHCFSSLNRSAWEPRARSIILVPNFSIFDNTATGHEPTKAPIGPPWSSSYISLSRVQEHDTMVSFRRGWLTVHRSLQLFQRILRDSKRGFVRFAQYVEVSLYSCRTVLVRRDKPLYYCKLTSHDCSTVVAQSRRFWLICLYCCKLSLVANKMHNLTIRFSLGIDLRGEPVATRYCSGKSVTFEPF